MPLHVDWSTGTGPYPSITLRMDFRGQIVGNFVYHCHILGHEDAGMMVSSRPKRRYVFENPGFARNNRMARIQARRITENGIDGLSDMLHCHSCAKCNSTGLRRSEVCNIFEWWLVSIVIPYRCRVCLHRQFRWRFIRISPADPHAHKPTPGG